VIYVMRYRLEEAHTNFARSTQVSTLSGYSDAEIFHHVIRSRLAQIDEDVDAGTREIKKAVELMRTDAPAAIREEVVSQQVRMALLQNEPTEAEAALKPYGYRFQKKLSILDLEENQVIDRSIGLLVISALRIILYQGRNEGQLVGLGQGIDLVDRLIALAHNSHALPIILEALLVRAQMQVVLGDEQASRADVVTAVELAEPEGFIVLCQLSQCWIICIRPSMHS
jgi:hypothetical protein